MIQNKVYLDALSQNTNSSQSNYVDDKFSRNYYQESFFITTTDSYIKNEFYIKYIQLESNSSIKILFSNLSKLKQHTQGTKFGKVIQVYIEEKLYTIWFPISPEKIHFDADERILDKAKFSTDYIWKFDSQISLEIDKTEVEAEGIIAFPYLIIKDPNSQFFEEITSLSEVEKKLYRKSNWFYANQPLDVWNYLINGSLYDPRSHKGINKRFKCQQCAYAWWTYFNLLKEETGKKIYDILQDEIAYTVLLDLKDNGEWGHGFWSDDIETHTRFHLDGLHLLISQFEKTNDPMWLQAAERGMDFVIQNLTEPLVNDQIWFLHDTIEGQRHHHFQSTLFGKTVTNSLCINTHVQALTVLHRLRKIKPEATQYETLFQQGVNALQTALEYKPAERIYRILDWLMQEFLPAWSPANETTKKRGVKEKVKARIKNRVGPYFPKFYWKIREKYPRLVHSNGFTERDLSLSFASDRYHIINLKDFLTLYQQEPLPWLIPYIEKGIEFARKLDLKDAIKRSPYYIEWVEILFLYNRLFNKNIDSEIQQAEKTIYEEINGYSLDYYASEFLE